MQGMPKLILLCSAARGHGAAYFLMKEALDVIKAP